jgi:hypothetical protein
LQSTYPDLRTLAYSALITLLHECTVTLILRKINCQKMEVHHLQEELARTKAELEAWRQEAELLKATVNTVSRRPRSLIPGAQYVFDMVSRAPNSDHQPLEVTYEDVASVSATHGLATVLCKFAELKDQSLSNLVRGLVAEGTLVTDPALPAPLGPGVHNKVRTYLA